MRELGKQLGRLLARSVTRFCAAEGALDVCADEPFLDGEPRKLCHRMGT